jgi:hypothetical protein
MSTEYASERDDIMNQESKISGRDPLVSWLVHTANYYLQSNGVSPRSGPASP